MRARKKTLTVISCVAIVGAAVAVLFAESGQVRAQTEPGADDAVKVGTYDQQSAFMQYPGREKLVEAYQEAQKENGQDQATQQRLQKIQQEVIEDFRSDVSEVVPDVAEEAGVQVIATGVKYTADDISTRDVTPEIVEAIGGDPEALEQPGPVGAEQE